MATSLRYSDGDQPSGPNASVLKSIGMLVVTVFLAIFGVVASFNMFESLDADEIMVVQSPVSGELTWHTTPGMKWQGFGKYTKFHKRGIYKFELLPENKDKDGKPTGPDGRIKVRFNDGGHGWMDGSVQFELPTDDKHLNLILSNFNTEEAVQSQLVERAVMKSVYLTGPMMSSKESYAEKKNDFLRFVEDQIEHGVYRTTQVQQTVKDSLTGEEKTVTTSQIVVDQKTGNFVRQEESVLSPFGIKTFGLAIRDLEYDDTVDKQIKQQQSITMAVQTSIAQAKQAEQRTLTVKAEGEADAAKAKWEQEVIKAKAVVLAEQERDVATLKATAAEQYKKEQLLRADADSTYRRTMMQADGALGQKLDAYKFVNHEYARAIAEHAGPWTPSVIMGGAAGGYSNAAQPLIEMLTAKTAKDLGLDMGMTAPK